MWKAYWFTLWNALPSLFSSMDGVCWNGKEGCDWKLLHSILGACMFKLGWEDCSTQRFVIPFFLVHKRLWRWYRKPLAKPRSIRSFVIIVSLFRFRMRPLLKSKKFFARAAGRVSCRWIGLFHANGNIRGSMSSPCLFLYAWKKVKNEDFLGPNIHLRPLARNVKRSTISGDPDIWNPLLTSTTISLQHTTTQPWQAPSLRRRESTNQALRMLLQLGIKWPLLI
jgi:hypothetical protein